jgi:hypothetical protein
MEVLKVLVRRCSATMSDLSDCYVIKRGSEVLVYKEIALFETTPVGTCVVRTMAYRTQSHHLPDKTINKVHVVSRRARQAASHMHACSPTCAWPRNRP